MPSQWEAVIGWIARIALAFYLARAALDLRALKRPQPKVMILARWMWTFAFAFHLIHVLLAFAYIHRWSHADAFNHVRERTLEMTGFEAGFGIWINYLFTLCWFVDVISWWNRGIDWPYRSRAYLLTLHAVCIFMFVNATIVFGPKFWRLWLW